MGRAGGDVREGTCEVCAWGVSAWGGEGGSQSAGAASAAPVWRRRSLVAEVQALTSQQSRVTSAEEGKVGLIEEEGYGRWEEGEGNFKGE